MKRFTLVCLLLIGCLCMNGFIIAPAKSADVTDAANSNITAKATPDMQEVEKAHLEHILSINNIYGDGFTDNETLVNSAALTLRSYADSDGFIPEEIVTAHIKALYDIDLVITDNINSEMPKKEGYVYLIPRGYTSYTHDIISATWDGDTMVVYSAITANYHDSGTILGTATSILQKNENSEFGYNILDAYINYDVNSIVL